MAGDGSDVVDLCGFMNAEDKVRHLREIVKHLEAKVEVRKAPQRAANDRQQEIQKGYLAAQERWTAAKTAVDIAKAAVNECESAPGGAEREEHAALVADQRDAIVEEKRVHALSTAQWHARGKGAAECKVIDAEMKAAVLEMKEAQKELEKHTAGQGGEGVAIACPGVSMYFLSTNRDARLRPRHAPHPLRPPAVRAPPPGEDGEAPRRGRGQRPAVQVQLHRVSEPFGSCSFVLFVFIFPSTVLQVRQQLPDLPGVQGQAGERVQERKADGTMPVRGLRVNIVNNVCLDV
jgi:hypothetical protein